MCVMHILGLARALQRYVYTLVTSTVPVMEQVPSLCISIIHDSTACFVRSALITSLPRTSSVTTRLERPKAPAGKPGPRRATVSTRPPTFSGPPRAPRGPREERACAASSPRAMPRRRTSARMRLSRKRGRRVCRGPASEPRRVPRASSTPPLRRSGSEGPHHDLLVSTCK